MFPLLTSPIIFFQKVYKLIPLPGCHTKGDLQVAWQTSLLASVWSKPIPWRQLMFLPLWTNALIGIATQSDWTDNNGFQTHRYGQRIVPVKEMVLTFRLSSSQNYLKSVFISIAKISALLDSVTISKLKAPV